jgi:hypothetical protein
MGCLPTGVLLHISETLVCKQSISGHGCIKKYDQIEPIYLPQSVVTYISLHLVYIGTEMSNNRKTERLHLTIQCSNGYVASLQSLSSSQFNYKNSNTLIMQLSMKSEDYDAYKPVRI